MFSKDSYLRKKNKMKDVAAGGRYPFKIQLAESASAIIIKVQKLTNFFKRIQLFSPKSEYSLNNM